VGWAGERKEPGDAVMELYNRFWSKVSVGKEKDCWPWRAYKDRGGYGSFYLDKMPQKAHRVAWELAIGPIPLGMCVLHKCDQRDCCNPAHLFCGTLIEQQLDISKEEKAGNIWRTYE